MTIRSMSMSIARWVLVALLGASHSASAQTANPPPKKTHRVQDPEAVALNNLLAAGQAAMERKDYATAEQSYQQYLAKRPDDANIHFQLGYAYTAQQKFSDAQTEYEKAIAFDPKMAPAFLNLGLTLLDSDPVAAIEPLQKAVELTPGQAEPKYFLGTAFERSGRPALAIEQYKAAEKLDEKHFETRMALGRALLKSNHSGDAESEFRAALALRPDSARAQLGVAQSLSVQKKSEAAAAELAAYLKLQPQDVEVRIERASILAGLGKNDEALSELDRLDKTGPESLSLLKLRAQIYLLAKRFDDAAAVLEKAVKLAPQDVDIPAQLGHAYLEKKDYPNAVRVLIVAWKMSPSENDVLGDLIAAEYLNKNYSAALRGLDVLSKRKTLPLGTLFVRATCYDKLGQVAEALEAYQQFLLVNKDENSDMYFEASARARFLARELKEKKR
jgi:tetratricopeptide (TPR) repeat protein